MKRKLLYGAVLVSSAMLVACGGSSSSEPDKGKSNPIEDKGSSKVIDLAATDEGLYVAARFALDNSLFWEHFVGASPEAPGWEAGEGGSSFEGCFNASPVANTVSVFGENIAVYQCNEETAEDGYNVKGIKTTGIKLDTSQWLGYYSLSGDSDNTPHTYKDDDLSAEINAELFVKANGSANPYESHGSANPYESHGSANPYESQRNYFVDIKQTETFGEYVRGQTLKLGASREVPFEVFVRDGLYDIEGPISLALRKGNIECRFSISTLKTIEKPELEFEPISNSYDPDELELVAIRGGKLKLDGNTIVFGNDGESATVNSKPVDLDKVDELFSECGEEG